MIPHVPENCAGSMKGEIFHAIERLGDLNLFAVRVMYSLPQGAQYDSPLLAVVSGFGKLLHLLRSGSPDIRVGRILYFSFNFRVSVDPIFQCTKKRIELDGHLKTLKVDRYLLKKWPSMTSRFPLYCPLYMFYRENTDFTAEKISSNPVQVIKS